MNAALYLFEDRGGEAFIPFSLTRPVGELLFGAFLQRERSERFWGASCLGYLAEEGLGGFSEPGSPPVLNPDGMESGYRIVQSSRFAPRGPCPPFPGEAVTLTSRGEVVGWILPAGIPTPDALQAHELSPLNDAGTLELEGILLQAPWDLVARNGDQLRVDIPASFPGYAVEELPGSHILGNGLLSIGKGVVVEPGSVFDLKKGPIRLSEGVEVRALSRLEGPAFIGSDSVILGGALSDISLGPVCKVRGEVECSIVLGYSNKAHDGFLGHSYLGRWVNLGAFTTNSDLKNNYGEVRVGSPGGPVGTGMVKVGCFLGDHVKTGIGTLLNTGTVVGAGSNLFGGEMPPAYVPPFSWGRGKNLSEFELEKFLEVAARVMARRGMELGAETEALLRRAWDFTRKERSHAP